MDIGAFQQRNFVHTHTLAIKIKMVSLLSVAVGRVRQGRSHSGLLTAQGNFTSLGECSTRCVILNGDITSIEERQAIIDRFRATPGGILYVGIQVGGVGLNLNFATQVILTVISWNPMDDWQAIARVHRMGQTNEVRVYRLCVSKGPSRNGRTGLLSTRASSRAPSSMNRM